MPSGLYRARIKGRPPKDVASFLSSVEEDEWIVLEDLLATQAHVVMLREVGLLRREQARILLRALEELKRKAAPSLSGLAKDRGYEDLHELIEGHLMERLGPDVAGRLHTARSRNDQVIVAIRMKMRSELLEVGSRLLELMGSLLYKAEGQEELPLPLYTHLQQAQIGSWGHYLLAQLDVLARDLERIFQLYDRVNRSPLGAAAIGGTSLPIDRALTARLLGFDGLVENSIDCISSRDVMVEAAAQMAILMVDLSRLAEDLILWSSEEFGMVELADEYASTSSMMPQKKNPCTLELIRSKAGVVAGELQALIGITKGLATGYSRDLQDTKPPLRRAFLHTKESLAIMKGAIDTLRVRADRMRRLAKDSYALAVDLVEFLVMKHEVPFRKAHRLVGELVLRAHSSGRGLRAEEVAKVLSEDLGKRIEERELEEILSPEASLRRRRSLGSPSPSEVRRMWRDRKKLLEAKRNELEWRSKTLSNALEELTKTLKR